MRELIVPIAVLATLGSMIVPLPPGLLDLLLVINLVLAFVLLVSTLYISEPIKLSSLPTILLLATLYRLALNVSTTRLVLSGGNAGDVVEAFGHVVIQDNLVVGAVIFLIITLIQFIVIAKGSERVAEVAARFTLDALPGKQMSIDADVRAGLIDFESARQKRQDLQTESRFYGALDGAMKFIKGDAVAGIIITAINIVGGLALGMLVEGLSVGEAASRYTLLTVGDGLVSQIPALLNALAAGMVVTRVTRGDGAPLARELLAQLGQLRIVKFISAGMAFLLACVPDLPALPFVSIGLVVLLSGCMMPTPAPPEGRVAHPRFQPRVPPLLEVGVPVELQPATAAAPLAEEEERFREDLFTRRGLLLPRVEFVPVPDSTGGFRVFFRGIAVLHLGDSDRPRLWEGLRELVMTRVVECIDDTLTRRTLDQFEREAPELVAAVVPGIITLTQLTEILKGLVREDLSIRNFDIILQAVAEAGPRAGNERVLLQEVRVGLRRLISAAHSGVAGRIEGYTLDPVIDLAFARAGREGNTVPLDCIDVIARYLHEQGEAYPLVVSKGARGLLFECLHLRGVRNPVVAFEEIVPEVRFVALGHIAFESGDRSEALVEGLAA